MLTKVIIFPQVESKTYFHGGCCQSYRSNEGVTPDGNGSNNILESNLTSIDLGIPCNKSYHRF